MHRGVVTSLVLLAAMTAVASAQSSSGSTSASIFANSTTTNFNSSSSSSSFKTQCEMCRDEGDCSNAYNGDTGQFCNTWVDSFQLHHACCCPTSAECPLFTNYRSYGCTCQHKRSDSMNFWIWMGIGAVFIVIGLLIGRAFWLATCKRLRQQHHPTGVDVIYVQQPVYIQGVNAQQSYDTQPMYSQGSHRQHT